MSFIVPENLHIVLILAVGFTFASLFGYIAQKIRLSPIVGYLVAGYLIGPYSPGFVADLATAEQLAEIGVILMMFGVGLHFKWQDLYNVKSVAIPGAIVQTVVSALVCLAALYYVGWTFESALVVGLAIGVASTVVLVRILFAHNLLNSPQGHIAVGWLIVEDILTVMALLLLPLIALFHMEETPSILRVSQSIFEVILKFTVMAVLVLTFGRWLVTKALFSIARVRLEELFTITLLALIFVIAVGSTILFGTSIALGAFAAGMVIAQTVAKHQALANALPLKDAFAVIFFISVGMLFKPTAIWENWVAFCIILSIVLIVKPLIALLLTTLLKYPLKTGLVVAVALGQIGEFSFILAEEGLKFNLLPDEGFDIIVACSIISIALNPLLFSWALKYLEERDRIRGATWLQDSALLTPRETAVVIGFGPVGKLAAETLEKIGFDISIIEQNIDTVEEIKRTHRHAVYGDAALRKILEVAGIKEAKILVITPPTIQTHLATIHLAKELNPELDILCRVRYEVDKNLLLPLGVQVICSEEEAARSIHEALRERSSFT